MRDSVELHGAMRDAIEADIARRTAMHQASVARLKSFRKLAAAAALTAAPAAPAPEPLVMLAHGDSWFDYPLNGNSVSLRSTDIIAHLETLGQVNPLVLNVSHFGDATTAELSLPKQQRMLQALEDPRNWLSSGKPDAILFSGGGDDIAGDQFCIYLDYAFSGGNGLDMARLQGALDVIRASYQDLFLFRDVYASGVPIFAHCYDFPLPNGAHPDCAGPWLKPSLDFCGWNTQQGTDIVRAALVAFKNMLDGLAQDAANNFTVVATQGLLDPDTDWANELHPYPGGFQTLARAFVAALRGKFPGRI